MYLKMGTQVDLKMDPRRPNLRCWERIPGVKNPILGVNFIGGLHMKQPSKKL